MPKESASYLGELVMLKAGWLGMTIEARCKADTQLTYYRIEWLYHAKAKPPSNDPTWYSELAIISWHQVFLEDGGKL